MTVSAGGPWQELALLAEQDDNALDLTEGVLALAALEHPLRDRDRYRALLDAMAGALPVVVTAADRGRAMAETLIGRFFMNGGGEDGDSPNLIQVLETRRGPPVPLGIVWMAVARRRGWQIEALAFPNHLLVRLVDEDGGRAVVDPHGGGSLLGPAELRSLLKAINGNGAELTPAHHAPLTLREVMLRQQTVVKLTHLRLGRLHEAIRSVEATLLFAPAQTALWRELGLMHLRLEEIPQAIAALERFVAMAPQSALRNRVRLLLAELKSGRS